MESETAPPYCVLEVAWSSGHCCWRTILECGVLQFFFSVITHDANSATTTRIASGRAKEEEVEEDGPPKRHGCVSEVSRHDSETIEVE